MSPSDWTVMPVTPRVSAAEQVGPAEHGQGESYRQLVEVLALSSDGRVSVVRADQGPQCMMPFVATYAGPAADVRHAVGDKEVDQRLMQLVVEVVVVERELPSFKWLRAHVDILKTAVSITSRPNVYSQPYGVHKTLLLACK